MNERILVIEDDPATLRLITCTLQQENYQLLTAVNGLAGIIKAKKENPDLILLDVMLPGIDGFEVCHRLKTEDSDNFLRCHSRADENPVVIEILNWFLALPLKIRLLRFFPLFLLVEK